MPPIQPLTETELRTRLGDELYPVWQQLTALIETHYEMDILWSINTKTNVVEQKYRRGGKTLCALYLREGSLGFMVIYGRAEQEKFEAGVQQFTAPVIEIYQAAHPYHDGRWLMLEMAGGELLPQVLPLLRIKRKPNRTPA